VETPVRRSFRIAIEGMHCGACEKLVTMHLSAVEGVGSVTANATAGTVVITADPGVDLGALEAGIVAAGFTPAGGAVTLEPIDDAEILAEPAPEAALADVEACPTAVCPVVPDDEPGDVVVTPAGSATREAVFGISGMTCASCVAVVEKTVGRMPGVATAVVNLATERLSVAFDPSVTDEAAIAAAVTGVGYGAALLSGNAVAPVEGKTTLGILGMTCSSCQAVIEKTLARLDGVSSAVVNLANETATVEFDPAVIGVDELIAAVRGAGYDAMVRVEAVEAGESAIDAQREAQQAHVAHEMRLLVLSAALSVPLLLMMFQPFMDATPTLLSFWLAKTVGGAWDPMATGST